MNIRTSQVFSKVKSEHYAFTLIFFIAVSFFLYFQPLQSHFFHYDDKDAIQHNKNIEEPGNLKKIFTVFNTRSAVGFSFALNHWLSRDDPYGYRLVNIMLHAFNAFLVYVLMGLTLLLAQDKIHLKIKAARLISFFIALLFLVHPVQSEAINFITQRLVLMASFFYLATLILYLKSRLTNKAGYRIGAVITCLLAMFSKEFTITLPFMILIYEIVFLNHFREKFSKKIISIVPFLLMTAIIPITLLNTSSSTTGIARIAAVNLAQAEESAQIHPVDITRAQGSPLSRKEYFLTQLNVIRTYLRLLFCPVNQNIDYDYPIFYNFKNSPTVLSAITIFLLFLCAIGIYRYNRLLSFAVFWFFLTLSVESGFIPIAHVIAEYRLYLPSIGFFLCFVSLAFGLLKNPKLSITVLSCCAMVLSALTMIRNNVWSDEVKLWEDTVKKSPFKARPYANLGTALMDKKQYAQAMPYLQKALSLDPLDFITLYDIAANLSKSGDFPGALEYSLKALELNPDNLDYRRLTGYIYAKLKNFDKAIMYYEEVLRREPNEKNAFEYFKLVLSYSQYSRERKNPEEYIKVLRDCGFDGLADQLRQI